MDSSQTMLSRISRRQHNDDGERRTVAGWAGGRSIPPRCRDCPMRRTRRVSEAVTTNSAQCPLQSQETDRASYGLWLRLDNYRSILWDAAGFGT